MGREIKRVALDFEWPMSETWEGFLNPHYRKCPTCEDGSGATRASRQLGSMIHLLMMCGSYPNSTHPYFDSTPLGRESLDPAIREVTVGLAGRDLGGGAFGGGHDACDRWSATQKIIKAAGLPKDWGLCPTCKGEGVDPDVVRAWKRWKPKEPPAGEGWQVWETVSEGSPITPVLPTADALVDYLCTVGDDWTRKRIADRREGYGLPTRAQAEAFVKSGWVPSMIAGPDGIKEGIECAS